jgi:TolA-binding protein
MKTLTEKLVYIQGRLKAPKNQRNSFGNYNYRNQEDILEALKPLLVETGLCLTIEDEIKEIVGIPYAESIAYLTDGNETKKGKGEAGINVNKKGMDIAQSFGSSSSYARKYALGGLFLIDDNKDADATNTHGKSISEDLNWLNAGTEQFNNAKKAISSGKFKIQDVRKKYKISKEVEKQLLN